MQEFYIKQGSINPPLRMEVVNNGRYCFREFYEAIQDATITFSMFNVDNNIKKIIKQQATIEPISGCEERYAIVYNWKVKDVNAIGTYQGIFDIEFNGNITQEDIVYPIGNLKLPIRDDLIIIVK